MSEEQEQRELTIFDLGTKERQQAIHNLLKGKTPINEVKKREGRGGKEYKFVNIYYMTRQIALLTGFRWSVTYLEDRARPNWEKPIEVGVRIEVAIWDANGNRYTQSSWGQKDVVRYTKDDPKGSYKAGDIISLFDDLKAAESDAIKKALSYFGIANDVYGGKELEYFSSDEGNGQGVDMTGDTASRAFGKFLSEKHIPVSKALEILKLGKLSEISDYKAAHDVLVKELEL